MQPINVTVRALCVRRWALCLIWSLLLLGTACLVGQAQTFKTLHVFHHVSELGTGPLASVIQARDSNLYGTTSSGGTFYWGTVFKLDLAGNLTILHSFDANSEGAAPHANLFQASDGNLYGTAYQGGPNGAGTVFKLDLAGNFTVVHVFNSSDGANPYAGLIQASDGNLYGTTNQGGAFNKGTVFKVDMAGHFSVIHTFNGSDGANSYAGLIQANDGNLYGTTCQGGAFNTGTVFKLDLAGNFSVLHSFSYPCKIRSKTRTHSVLKCAVIPLENAQAFQ